MFGRSLQWRLRLMARERIDTVPPVEDMLLGTTIGDRYAVERIIGRGGMGVVYAGRHEELQRPIAIKVLMPVWSTQPEAIGRFFQEARTASSVGHPNIVDVYDLGRLPDERPYLVMPLLDGVTLSEYLEEHGPQKEERVVELLSGVAGALDLMHTKGMVHRDIKPDNMMLVRREDGEETVKLLDFGLAA
ncbi:MAG: serine/threonine protein kinase, partial [Polyangiales bacterium]